MTSLDQFEVQQLLARYAFAMDKFDPDDVASLFTSDGAFMSPHDGTARGHAAIKELIARKRERSRSNPTGVRRRFVTNHVISIKGDRGTFHAGILETLFHDDKVEVVLTGHYQGVVVKEADGQWRFAEREAITDTP